MYIGSETANSLVSAGQAVFVQDLEGPSFAFSIGTLLFYNSDSDLIPPTRAMYSSTSAVL
jgi:hypothetical protein